jgi:uncharacterized membrane protein YphA (DoxX/SURF4 family)
MARSSARDVERAVAASRWTLATRLAFRFSVVHLALFCLATQISGSMAPNLLFSYRGLGQHWPMEDITRWVGRNLLGLTYGLDESARGGESLFFWSQTLWLTAVSLAAALVWSIADRQRLHYTTLHGWARLVVRLALAASLFEYGMTKIIPTQFPPPSLVTLVTPVGDLTLSALLWTSIGSAPVYEIFTGCVEVLAGVLLLLPNTTLLGATIGLAAMMQVFVLNMTYDVGVKMISLHLVALAAFLLAPETPRLIDFFLRGRPVAPYAPPTLLRTVRANRLARAALIGFGVYLLGMYAYINATFWYVGGPGAPRSPLYGIWDVEELSVDGQVRPPTLNDYDRRWRRMIAEGPDSIVFQRTDDSFARYGASLDPSGRNLALTKGTSRTWKASFKVGRPSDDRLTLDGSMDGLRIEMRLRRVELDTLRLLNSPFRWVRPHER